MNDCAATQMQAAVERRRRARRALQKLRPGLQHTAQVVHSSSEDWERIKPLQHALLEAELDVIRIAVVGVRICDFAVRCKDATKEAWRDDIAFELEKMFLLVIAPAQKIRTFLHRASLPDRKRAWARKTLMVMLRAPLTAMLSMGDELAFALLQCVRGGKPDSRVRLGLVRVLMFISDCFRYSLDHEKSNEAVRLMHVLSPADPEAHMRLALNFAMLDGDEQAIRAFFHYCVFLANRKVPVDHKEAVVVVNFVKRPESQPQSLAARSGSDGARGKFYRSFITILWTILSENADTASDSIHNASLWDSFSQHLKEGIPREDMLHIVGALIFVHHRMSPRGTPDGAILPQCEHTDFVLGQVIRFTASTITKQLQTLYTALRSRKKNRRRAMQKKRRADGTEIHNDATILIGFDVLKTMVDLEMTTPALGSLSILTHYWSKARGAPAPTTDLKPLGYTLDALYSLRNELERIEELTCIATLTSQITTKILEDVGGLIPSMPEDMKFWSLLPCKDRELFRQTSIHQAPLPSVLRDEKDGMIRLALKAMKDASYESLVATTAMKHLEAFSQQCAKDAAAREEQTLDKEAACEVVRLTVRKFRIQQLITDLEKVGGGKLRRMSLNSTVDKAAAEGELVVNDMPTPGQPRASIAENDDSWDRPMSPKEVGAKLRKRRRVIGNCSLSIAGASMTASQSQPSSTEKPPATGGDMHAIRRRECRSGGAVRKVPDTTLQNLRGPQVPLHEARSPCPVSRGSLLSQGSLQLVYAQMPEEACEHERNEKRLAEADVPDLSTLLRLALYPPKEELSGYTVDRPALWRSPPSQEFMQTIFKTGYSVGEG